MVLSIGGGLKLGGRAKLLSAHIPTFGRSVVVPVLLMLGGVRIGD
jgi:hypothetical protein